MSRIAIMPVLLPLILISHVRAHEMAKEEREFRELRDAYLARYKPMFIEASQAWWDANTTGADEAFAKRKSVESAIVELKSDKTVFARLKAIRDSGRVRDPVMARELDVLYRSFVPGQADPELNKKTIAIESDVEQIFNAHRSTVDGKELSENDVRKILGETKDAAAAEKAWKGYMEVGRKIDPKLRELVRLRNELARKLGYRNFYNMKLSLEEIEEAELLKLFDELDDLTREPFAKLKAEIDRRQADRFGVKPAELRPWNFSDLFFQEAPELEAVDLDAVYQDQDLISLAKKYYAGLGMSIDDIIARSDLYEKPKKSPHAFCTNINRADDVRVLCNMKPNLFWADTSLHELGHAVYDKYISPDVPFLLHEPAHSITTEGYAMLIGAMAKNADYLEKAVRLSPDKARQYGDAARRQLRAEKLIFSRWTQVMVRFEHGMYSNPDQDLGKLWWDLKKKYQMLNPPEMTNRPDYAAKIHIVTTPVYYHSYMMGELFACQVRMKIARDIDKISDPNRSCFFGRKDVGDYMRKDIFEPGNLRPWNELTRRATGEPLTAKYFAEMYVRG